MINEITDEMLDKIREYFNCIFETELSENGRLAYEDVGAGDNSIIVCELTDDSVQDCKERAKTEFEENFESHDNWLDPSFENYDDQKQKIIEYVKTL